jgi:RimJ/RimL family protein N-acetyltransferase
MEKTFTPAYRIHTHRLILRCWEPVDAPLLTAAVDANRDHLRPWMPWAAGEPDPIKTVIQRLRINRAKFDLDENYVYAIFNPAETQVLGGTGLHPRVGANGIEIGYWIDADHLGLGLATEVTAALTKIVFEIHELDRVEIHCEPENAPSAAVPRKLGYHHEATLRRRSQFSEDDLRDSMIWTLFASDYPNSRAAQAKITAFDATGTKILTY